jgi:hypothetical protein
MPKRKQPNGKPPAHGINRPSIKLESISNELLQATPVRISQLAQRESLFGMARTPILFHPRMLNLFRSQCFIDARTA